MHRNVALFSAGSLALLAGVSFYASCREMPPPLIAALFSAGPLRACGEGAVNALPTLTHVFGFTLMTTALLNTSRGSLVRHAAVSAVLWLTINWFFEWLSLVGPSSLARSLPVPWAELLTAGVFDPRDLMAAALGAASAFALAISYRNTRSDAITQTRDSSGDATP